MSSSWRKFKRRLVSDFKASPLKTAILAGLVVCAGFIVVPQMQSTPSQPVAPVKRPQPNSDPIVVVAELEDGSADEPVNRIPLASDPLVRPVALELEMGEFGPFTVDPAQFSPPIEFATEPQPEPAAAGPAVSQTPSIKLSSIVFGRRRKAALINDELCFEGEDIVLANEDRLTLVKVLRDRVVVRLKSVEYELELDDDQLRSKIRPASGTE